MNQNRPFIDSTIFDTKSVLKKQLGINTLSNSNELLTGCIAALFAYGIGGAGLNSRQQATLKDMLLILAGENGGLINQDSYSGKYKPLLEDGAQEKFYDTVQDKALADLVLSSMQDSDVLEDQLRIIGEWPKFTLRVLKLTVDSGDNIEVLTNNMPADSKHEIVKNTRFYEQHFGHDHGPIFPAWVSFRVDGTKCLTLLAPRALAIINSIKNKTYSDNEIAELQHEFAHTAQNFLTGTRNQFGLLLEERKAEALSGDRRYIDVNHTVYAFSVITGFDLVSTIKKSMRSRDALAYLLTRLIKNTNPYLTALLMLAKPFRVYSSPIHSEYDVDLDAFLASEEHSLLDTLVNQAAISNKVGMANYCSKVAKHCKSAIEAGLDPSAVAANLQYEGLNKIAEIYKQEIANL